MAGLPPGQIISDAEWGKIVEGAKKEGTLMVYQWESAFWRPPWAAKEFERLYGIKVETLSLNSAVLQERVASEARAGIYKADVMSLIGTYFPRMEKMAWLKRIDNLPSLADAYNPELWHASPVRTPYYLRAPAIRKDVFDYAYSTKVVPPERLPRKLEDFLDPWWQKTKICTADPAMSNAANLVMWRPWRGLQYSDWYPGLFFDIYNKAAGRILFSVPGQPSPMIRGECGIDIPFYGVAAGDFKKSYAVDQEAPWMAAGNYDSPIPVYGLDQGASGVLEKAPHPNAALLFMNWRFSKEGQEAWAKNSGARVAMRRDVPDFIEDKYKPTKGKGVTHYWVDEPEWSDFEEYTAVTKMFLRMSKETVSKEAWLKQVKDVTASFWGQYPPPARPLYPFD